MKDDGFKPIHVNTSVIMELSVTGDEPSSAGVMEGDKDATVDAADGVETTIDSDVREVVPGVKASVVDCCSCSSTAAGMSDDDASSDIGVVVVVVVDVDSAAGLVGSGGNGALTAVSGWGAGTEPAVTPGSVSEPVSCSSVTAGAVATVTSISSDVVELSIADALVESELVSESASKSDRPESNGEIVVDRSANEALTATVVSSLSSDSMGNDDSELLTAELELVSSAGTAEAIPGPAVTAAPKPAVTTPMRNQYPRVSGLTLRTVR
jgi:hypothetical protein